ncbi:MAG: (Fe-S)-binding protein [Methylococcales bacterium]|nr:(Fe-S)-binding protein [Methylococcales bacterium]
MFDFMDLEFNDAQQFESSGFYIPEASECMRCGQCVSGCPTFRLFQIHEETPRSRIRTISKILVEDLPVSAEELKHLNNCVQCRACETSCPSKMAYGQLFDAAQAKLQTPLNSLAKMAFYLIEHKNHRAWLMPFLKGYLKSGLRKPLQASKLLEKVNLAHAENLLTEPSLKSLFEIYPTNRIRRGSVALFTGCVAENFDRETLNAAIKLLNANGFNVQIPKQQSCCGAIHQHNGQDAKNLIENNLAVFNSLNVDAVIHVATGCGAMLNENENLKKRLFDINDFLLANWSDDLKLESSNLKVAVHEPCSGRNVLKNQQSVYALLEKIPDLNVNPLADNHICCGSGGSYMLTHPENATQLRDLKQQIIEDAKVDLVVSSNFGCVLHLNSNHTTVLHPLVLLAGQLI